MCRVACVARITPRLPHCLQGIPGSGAGRAQVELDSRRPIDQLQAVGEIDLILALSDGVLVLVSLTTMERTSKASFPSGISRFCVNEKGAPRFGLCLSVRKKIMLYSWATAARAFNYDKVRARRAVRRAAVVTSCRRRRRCCRSSPCPTRRWR